MKIQALASLTGIATSLLLAGQAHADPEPCNLLVDQEPHYLRAFDTDLYAQSVSGEGWVEERVDLDDAHIEFVREETDDTMFSIRLASDHTKYFAVVPSAYGYIDVLTDDGTTDFDNRSVFQMVDGLSTGSCNYSGVSFRLVYAMQQTYGGNYYLTADPGRGGALPALLRGPARW